MRRHPLTLRAALVAAAMAMVATEPARACDPEALDAELARVCDGALLPARAWIGAVRPHATAAEARAIDQALARARQTCDHGDPVAGAAEAARLARLAGRIEAGLGHAPPIWDAELALDVPRCRRGCDDA